MCGIAGYLSKESESLFPFLQSAVSCLSKRGPDMQNAVQLSASVGFAHSRLSIIDTSSVANQPMTDETGRYTIIFNGEIFNFRELKARYCKDVKFKSHSDTEVLLHLYIKQGKDCLQHLNGFFAFAVHDKQTQEIFLARDRFGIKPLYIYEDGSKVIFASELKAILQFPIKKKIDFASLLLYLQLNYIPGKRSMLQGVSKLPPAHYAIISPQGKLEFSRYYTIPYSSGEPTINALSYQQAQQQLKLLIEEAVQRRLVSDVPLGTFLSGGIDSSIITACAAKYISDLNTFSIGYKDDKFFDETAYANLVAKKFKTHHTVFSVSNEDMYSNIYDILDYTDEPFADSSAIAVYILCKNTRKKVTVALSGDGGDELFGGYNKHSAEVRSRNANFVNNLLKSGFPLLKMLPASRHTSAGNLARQLQRYAAGLNLSAAERYWRWCTFQTQNQALELLKAGGIEMLREADNTTTAITSIISSTGDINDVLLADTQMVLPDDMLRKVDMMSMANSLEVRVPLLDYTVVNFAFSLPAEYKNNGKDGKRVLKEAFKNDLPKELYNRPKRGFEVPLLKWLRTGLRPLIENDLLEPGFIEAQGIFKPAEIEKMKQKLFSNNPGDTHATIWALIVFQYWYKKYFA